MSMAIPENLRYKEIQRAWRTGLDGGLEGWFAKSHEPNELLTPIEIQTCLPEPPKGC